MARIASYAMNDASKQPLVCGPRLAGRTALVTGAGLGIGRATAICLAQHGARVIATDIDDTRLSDTLSMLPEGSDALAHRADVTDEQSVSDLFALVGETAPLDILVNNVGGGRPGRIWELSLEDWETTMRLSLTSMFLCTRAALPGMIERGYGRVVCLSSGARNGTVWNALHMGACAYSTAKAGIIGFVRDLAIELADSGVTINAVAPGPIDTELAGPFLRAMDEADLPYAPGKMVPMGRLGTPEEVANAILYLASSEASYVTGTTLDVAGGR